MDLHSSNSVVQGSVIFRCMPAIFFVCLLVPSFSLLPAFFWIDEVFFSHSICFGKWYCFYSLLFTSEIKKCMLMFKVNILTLFPNTIKAFKVPFSNSILHLSPPQFICCCGWAFWFLKIFLFFLLNSIWCYCFIYLAFRFTHFLCFCLYLLVSNTFHLKPFSSWMEHTI